MGGHFDTRFALLSDRLRWFVGGVGLAVWGWVEKQKAQY